MYDFSFEGFPFAFCSFTGNPKGTHSFWRFPKLDSSKWLRDRVVLLVSLLNPQQDRDTLQHATPSLAKALRVGTASEVLGHESQPSFGWRSKNLTHMDARMGVLDPPTWWFAVWFPSETNLKRLPSTKTGSVAHKYAIRVFLQVGGCCPFGFTSNTELRNSPLCSGHTWLWVKIKLPWDHRFLIHVSVYQGSYFGARHVFGFLIHVSICFYPLPFQGSSHLGVRSQ